MYKTGHLLFSFLILFFAGCGSKHLSISTDRKLNLSKESSPILYKYSKTNVSKQKGKSGFYPLPNHLDSLSARLILAKKATKSIKVQYFIFEADISGTLLMSALIDAADRGVKVDILIDDLLLNSSDNQLASVNAHKNITLRSFNPTNSRKAMHYVEIGIYTKTLGKRMHNKTFIVDNSMAVFGGRNIGNDYFGLDKKRYFIDDDILVVGNFVNILNNQFEQYFASKFSVDFENLAKADEHSMRKGLALVQEKLDSPEFKHFKKVLNDRAFNQQFLNAELDFYFANAELYFDMPNKVETEQNDRTHHIQGTFDDKYSPKKSLYIVNPYFIPSEEMVKKLQALRTKGVEIHIVTNSLESTDGKSVYAYYSKYQKELLKMGVHLYETFPSALKDELKNQAYNIHKIYPKTALHAKTMIIDGKYFVIGSKNLDPRSRNLNTELVAIIENKKLCTYEKTVFDYITKSNNAYKLSLECKDDKHCKVKWSGIIEGKEKTFFNHADASSWDKIRIFFARQFPIRELL